MVHAIAANFPVSSLEPVRVAAEILVNVPPPDLHRDRWDPIRAQRAHPSCEALGLGDFHLAAALRAEQIAPRLETQSRRAEIISALMHHWFHALLSPCSLPPIQRGRAGLAAQG